MFESGIKKEIEVFGMKLIDKMNTMRELHPVGYWGGVFIELVGIIFAISFSGVHSLGNFLATIIFYQFLIIPAILTYINIYLIFIKPKDDSNWKRSVRRFEILSMALGILFTLIFIRFLITFADWHERIAIGDMHFPLLINSIPTFVVICLIALIGYFALAYTETKKTPPLVTVLGISALYLGVFECVIWSIQISVDNYRILALFPINFIIIVARLIREKSLELKRNPNETAYNKKGFIGWLNKEFCSMRFPLWSLVLAFPLLGVIIGILVLGGQKPDYIIKGYTETADWALSQRIAPPGYDAHYLCTVAAQGHRSVVKPQRMGIRRGRPTIVNRQLCIANAFEQVLEQRIPKIHRVIRNFYDKHGFPLSKLIKTRIMADFIYIIMKPLEWFFLIVLYLFTVNPEQRIAQQYTK